MCEKNGGKCPEWVQFILGFFGALHVASIECYDRVTRWHCLVFCIESSWVVDCVSPPASMRLKRGFKEGLRALQRVKMKGPRTCWKRRCTPLHSRPSLSTIVSGRERERERERDASESADISVSYFSSHTGAHTQTCPTCVGGVRIHAHSPAICPRSSFELPPYVYVAFFL